MKKKDNFNLNVEKHKKNKIKTEKKPKTFDFKVRFNVLTFLTYACRNCYINKTFFITNCKSVQNIENYQIQNSLEKQQ